MRKYHFCIVLIIGIALSSCNGFHKKRQAGTAVELNGHSLYWATLDSLTAGLAPADSAEVASGYIRQWATDILEYDKAKDINHDEIEALVEDYRRSLYVHAYETRLVEHRMPTHVADTIVEQIYQEHIGQFVLKESIIKGLLLVVPQNAPHRKRLQQWLEKPDDNIEEIEKYAYRYATGYELFTDRWLTAQQVLLHIPFEKDELNSLLKQKKQIEVSDSTSLYILQITEKHMAGEPMPIDYARPEIEKRVLSRRQVDFLQNERKRLYDDAVLFKKIQFYERD